MEKLGIIIDKPGYNEKFYRICKALNEMQDFDCILFFLENGPIPFKVNFALMEAVYCLQYDGILMSTDCFTTEILNNNYNAKEKFFYVWDLEWLQKPNKFVYNDKIYNGDADIVAKSQSHYDLLNRVWKKPKGIMENFKYEKFTNL